MPKKQSGQGEILNPRVGTPNAVLSHTWSSVHWRNFWIDGRLSGEAAIEMGLAAEFGVPAIMISGDDKVCAEAVSLAPGIVTAQVKQGLSRYGAILLSREAAHSLITQKSTEAVKRCKEFKPLKINMPVVMKMEYTERAELPDVSDKPYAKRLDDRTYEVTGDSFRQAFFRITNLK